MAIKKNLGDIVTMPLPTQWAPARPGGYSVPQGRGGFLPGVSPGSPGGIPGSTGVPGGPGYSDDPGGLSVPNPVVGQMPFMPNGWNAPPLLPDSMLPPALQRTNPLLRRMRYIPNRYDFEIFGHAQVWKWIAENGGLKSCCRIPELGAPIWDNPPWQVRPSQGEDIEEMFGLPLASVSGGGPFDGTETVLGSFRVPSGYDGVLSRAVFGFTGTGFDDFSSNIVWRIRVGVRYARNLGQVINTFGSFQNAFAVPGIANIRLVSGQTVKIIASIPVGSPVMDGVVTGGVFGWLYPRR